MHPAWEIEDIRYLIFNYFTPRDFAQLAQTCNYLFRLSTDELWKTMISFSPFIFCLPRDFNRRRLQNADIQRLDLYSSKVRHISFLSTTAAKNIRQAPPFHPQKPKLRKFNQAWRNVWKDIAKLRPRSEFLPNIQSISMDNVGCEILLPLTGISGLNITKIYIKLAHHTIKALMMEFLN